MNKTIICVFPLTNSSSFLFYAPFSGTSLNSDEDEEVAILSLPLLFLFRRWHCMQYCVLLGLWIFSFFDPHYFWLNSPWKLASSAMCVQKNLDADKFPLAMSSFSNCPNTSESMGHCIPKKSLFLFSPHYLAVCQIKHFIFGVLCSCASILLLFSVP